ncbi:heme ABC transporter ATP-binding protein [Gluconobacter sp. Dm-62]|uniref:heme ABC transporter ATP-binding protein n=1 Tax=Gluconobacter sp. Dm-62 TaxID=2799804 RepID=UPI001B8AC328|nr:heme ABC transporter ATP-binding protein [Gluconobacter sp. Dm-62]MBS1101637.1 heme ABC transporter ATP-binding protein [Gluconobacter sp. Dm-62]
MSLQMKDVSYGLGGCVLLNGISFSVNPGEVVTVIGPNGAGKSTLLRLAAGLLAPSAGQITLDDRDLSTFSGADLAKRRAMLAQDSQLRARFSVRELAVLGRLGCSVTRLSEDRVTRALEDVGLAHLAERDILSLSGGERQRAHFARVLVQLRSTHERSRLLLLDEPISAQDPARQKLILTLARAHAHERGGSCLMVLHDLNWAAAVSDRIIVLHEGRIHAEGSPAEILTTDILTTTFRIAGQPVHVHEGSGRPFIIPHDMIHPALHAL